jgi:PST family polysaccharide transporter
VTDKIALLRRLAGHVTVRNALMLYGVQLSTYVFPLITLPYLSRVLSPEKFGLIGFALSFIWYFNTLTEYGFNLTATRRIAIAKDDPEQVSAIFSAVMTAKTLLTAAGFVIMMIAVFATPKLRANWPLFPISFLTVVGGLLFPTWLYQGVEKMGHVAARDFVAKALATVLIFVLVHRESDYIIAAAIQPLAAAVAGALSLLMAPRVCGVRFAIPTWRATYDMLREGWPVFLSMAALSLSASTNIVILGFVATAAQVGYYMAAFRLIVALRMLVIPISTALYPHVSRMAATSEESAMRFVRKYALYIAAPFVAGSLLLLVIAPLVVSIVFGPKYGPTGLLLRIMAPSPALLALSHTYSTYYILAFGYDKQWSRIVLQGTALNYILMACLLWWMQPTVAMAVIGTLVDIFCMAAAYLFYRRNTRSAVAQPPAAAPPGGGTASVTGMPA